MNNYIPKGTIGYNHKYKKNLWCFRKDLELVNADVLIVTSKEIINNTNLFEIQYENNDLEEQIRNWFDKNGIQFPYGKSHMNRFISKFIEPIFEKACMAPPSEQDLVWKNILDGNLD